ncbi:MAG: hypothetical protein IPL52_09970, partial [Flavobacteriales bacterium]|nr:hypothetical protein [Flavobacteriales bacterium]
MWWILQRHVAEEYWEMERDHRKGGKGVITQFGDFTSAARIQWMYVVTISPNKTTLYPLGWYYTRQGLHSMQIDAVGPATLIRPHVLDRYRVRYFKDADCIGALLEMHKRNYDKACEPRPYKGKPSIASAVQDGYFLSDREVVDGVVDFHTFYDVQMGAKEPALRDMRKLLEWRRYFTATNPKIGNNQPDA